MKVSDHCVEHPEALGLWTCPQLFRIPDGEQRFTNPVILRANHVTVMEIRKAAVLADRSPDVQALVSLFF
jgi:hypothetical protein